MLGRHADGCHYYCVAAYCVTALNHETEIQQSRTTDKSGLASQANSFHRHTATPVQYSYCIGSKQRNSAAVVINQSQ